MPKKILSSILIALALLTASIFPLLRPPTGASAQIIIGTLPIFTLPPIATATRTPTPISLGNFVWDDLDHDGRQDAGEPGIPGVTVQLWNSAKTQMIDSDITDSSGNYWVVAPLPGNYRIRVVLPALLDGFTPKDQAGGDNTLDSDINPTGADIGFTDIFNIASNVISMSNLDAGIIIFRTPTPTRTPTPINLGNFVWDDLDHDGRQDAGEPGLPGVTVQLWNSAKTQLIDSDITDSNGSYWVVAPLPGNYRIRVIKPTILDGFSPKDQAGGDDTDDSDINPTGTDTGFTDIFNIASNVISISKLDAGIIKFRTPTPTRTQTPINLGNLVWHDLNGNGIQNAGEPGVGGITIQLWNATKTQLIDSTVTNSSGSYTVVAPLPGDYRIRVVPFAGSSFSPKDQGSNTEDSDINPSGPDLGFTDVFNIATNVISISHLDAGLTQVAPSPTPTNTRTPTPGPSPTPSPTPSPQPDYDNHVHLPLIMRSE